jgi:LacI family transcriptional regulator
MSPQNPTAGFRPQDARRSATIRDVAARAGVSIATVSRVFNSASVVRKDTARRVLSAAQALQYAPHFAARNLSTRRTNTIGVLLPDLHGGFFSEVIRGIDGAARANGYQLLISGSHSDWSEMAAVLRATRGRVDGTIVMSPDLDGEALQPHLPQTLPVIFLNCPSAAGPTITIDNRRGAGMVVRHLASLGHRRIAFIRGPEHNADASQRLEGYRAALARQRGAAAPIELPGDFTESSGYQAALAAIAMHPRPTALFAANDSMAIGALSAFRQSGVQVPEEMAVVGFDDIPIARFATPPLTTVSVDLEAFGRRALELLLSIITGQGDGKQREVIRTRLIIRESCGAVRPRTASEKPVAVQRRSAG